MCGLWSPPGAPDSPSLQDQLYFFPKFRSCHPWRFSTFLSLVPLRLNILDGHMWKQFPLSFGRCQFTSVRGRLIFTLYWWSWPLKMPRHVCQLTRFQPNNCCLVRGGVCQSLGAELPTFVWKYKSVQFKNYMNCSHFWLNHRRWLSMLAGLKMTHLKTRLDGYIHASRLMQISGS